MTNSEKQAYLMQYQAAERRITRLLDEKTEWMEKATAISPTYSAVPRGKGNGNDRVQTAVSRIIDLEKELDKEIDRQVDLRLSIEGAVRKLDDDRFQDILRYRYIDGMTWEAIAAAMHFTYQWVCKLHGEALKAVEIDKADAANPADIPAPA